MNNVNRLNKTVIVKSDNPPYLGGIDYLVDPPPIKLI